MDFLARKPIEIDCLPTRLCFELSREIEKPNAILRRVPPKGMRCDSVDIPLKPSTVTACEYYFTLPDSILCKISTGRYQLILQEDCDFCDCRELQFTDRCMITHVEEAPQFADAGCPTCTMEITE